VSAYIEVLPPDADRAEWLAQRQAGIGSSDIAGVLGQSTWASPYSVWWSKVGPVTDDEPTEQMKWGIRLEPVICEAWSERTGIATTRIGLCRSVDRPWQMATPDRLTADGGLLETKTASAYDIDEWDDDTIPLKYLLQITHQMDVLGVDHGYLALLLGGSDFRVWDVPLDGEIVGIIRERGAAFWQLVESRTTPPTDGHDATTTAIKRRWGIPDDPEATVVLDADWIRRLNDRELLKVDIAVATKACTGIDNALREAIGAATHAVAAGLAVATWKPRKDGVRVLNITASDKRKELSS
jgi:putative phage-type endonuclease